MIIDYKLAKSMMENEEGLNHLWIRFSGADPSENKQVKINVGLPDGMFRLQNLNGHSEDEAGAIELTKFDDVMLEIYTVDQIACGDLAITVDISSMDKRKQRITRSINIPVRVVIEDEMVAVEIDDEVVNRLKQLSMNSTSNNLDELDVIGIRPNQSTSSNDYSFLEQKYRIDY